MAGSTDRQEASRFRIALLTGGQDRHYAYGLVEALAARGVAMDIIGSDEVDCPEFHNPPNINFLNLRGDQSRNARLDEKVLRVARYYARLVRYAATARPKLFHILWNNRWETFDRTALMAYYRLLGKKIVFTAHNTNIGKRDSTDSLLNRLTLRIQYRLAHHIFVHTPAMKDELLTEFAVPGPAVTVIRYGINNAVPNTGMGTRQARQRLGIGSDDKVILFFGAIAPYKGLDLLVEAFRTLSQGNGDYKLIIAGKPKGGCDGYLREIQRSIDAIAPGTVIQRIEYIADSDTELYFKAADVLVLPYRAIFQSGILFLAYSFGLPVVATDVGSIRDDVCEGKTGLVCKPDSPEELARTLVRYFQSDLFRDCEKHRQEIREYANARHSWDAAADLTLDIYRQLISPGAPH